MSASQNGRSEDRTPESQGFLPIRDPARKDRILVAAADLVAQKGYHAVSMSEIGATAGITGPAIYRHFEGKSAVLVALFDRVIDRLLAEALAIVNSNDDPHQTLVRLIEGQVEFVVQDRVLAQVYYNEIHNLPDRDRRRLRRKQRLYIEEWAHSLGELRSDLNDGEVHTIVHGAIGAIQSSLFHSVGLPAHRLNQLLDLSARAVLGVP
jgi:AcrR family transcriptional regulator